MLSQNKKGFSLLEMDNNLKKSDGNDSADKIAKKRRFLPACQSKAAGRSLTGFTLVEIMIVVGILGILLGMAMFSSNKARLQSKISKAKADIAALETAISMYEVDMGSYPTTENQSLVNALTVNQGGNWHGPYIEFYQEDISGGKFQDPWNNDYHYINPGTHNPSYDIYSTGPDGAGDGTGADDINNW